MELPFKPTVKQLEEINFLIKHEGFTFAEAVMELEKRNEKEFKDMIEETIKRR